ncbi:type II secretion system minor pseudopilin GspI [Pseudomonas sp. LFM046]|uniref:type II secretion system minor pseudopilin GspI n=1 Tax=Pseudomonas sp. LFM046 TaxID=1608357 RepID=UPI0005CFD478|nr:type II secretion system minor pseudopilin GspI [Pseudomonas sp. LFM046]
MRRSRAFTLIEVLVALAIFAVVAASVLTASARSLQIASRLEDKTLAMWIADNRLTELQLRETPPGNGRDQGELDYAGRRWEWLSQIEGTSDPALRRVTLWVAPKALRGSSGGKLEERATVRLVGFLGGTP